MRIFILGSVAVSESDPGFADEKARLEQACQRLGNEICSARHTTVLCSPFEGSADLGVLRGLATAPAHRSNDVEIHFPDAPHVRQRLTEVERELSIDNINRHPCSPPQVSTDDAWRHAWLLCQLEALDACQVLIALGGKPDGAANMLLLLAGSKRRKPMLPVPYFGGAAQQAFYRHRYELEDRLGDGVVALQDDHSIGQIVALAEQIASSPERRSQDRGTGPLRFFISYPRARPAEADHVESILRRRNMQVFRDETDFGAGHEIPGSIREAVHAANVFIALWCQEYACSPWCFDELELALERHEQGTLELWLLCVDATRIVPRRARDLVHYRINSREALEGRVLDLLGRTSIPSS